MEKQRTVAFHTLGCKLNFSETSTLSRHLEGQGFVKKEFEDEADVYVINTCSVTDNADKECRQLVRRIQRKAPESLVVCPAKAKGNIPNTGCGPGTGCCRKVQPGYPLARANQGRFSQDILLRY
jgi:tRNA A37 methylthiotransferase MiaB